LKCIDVIATPINKFVSSVFTDKTSPSDELSEETYQLVYELFKVSPELILASLKLLSVEF